MSLLVVGSIALDSIFTPFGETADALGGSAVYFSVAGALLHPVQVVGVVGSDYPVAELERLAPRGIDWSGVERAEGESFRWKGKYSYDLQSRETLDTRLGVFANFQPKLPEAFRSAKYLFLGNIDPELQLGVLGQVRKPSLVVCDTMNYWIQSKKATLLELLARVDVLMVNDSEARELSGDWNIHRAGRWILAHGPKRVVIKQGEYGALLIEPTRTFYVPAFPLESVYDPTGAGDAFAGGFMAYLARTGSVSEDNIRRAMVVGATMGSYAVEQFGIRGFDQVTLADVENESAGSRISPMSAWRSRSDDVGGEYAAAGVDLASADEAKARIGRLVAGTRTSLSVGKVGAFGGMVRIPAGMRRPTLVLSTDGVGTKVLVALQAGRFDTVGEDLVNHSVNDILVHGARPIAFMDYIAGSGLGLSRSPGWSRESPAAAGPTTWRWPAVRPRRCRDSTSREPTTSRARSSAWSRRMRRCTATRSCRATCSSPTPRRDSIPMDTRWPVGSCSSECGSASTTSSGHGPARRRCPPGGAPELCSSVLPVIGRLHGLAHITGGGIPGNLVRVLPEGCAAVVDPSSWTLPPLFAALQRGGRIATDEMREVFNLGVGLIAALPADAVDGAQAAALAAGVATWPMGEIRRGEPHVRFAAP